LKSAWDAAIPVFDGIISGDTWDWLILLISDLLWAFCSPCRPAMRLYALWLKMPSDVWNWVIWLWDWITLLTTALLKVLLYS